MLGGVRLKVSYTHERSCFAYISPKYSTNNDQTQCVQVMMKEKQIYLWVVFSSNIPEGYMACNPIYCRLVGLQEGTEVFISPYSNVKVLDEIYIDTDSPDDQEILEDNVEVLQLRILDQLRLVVANQKAIVWISTSMPIIFIPKQTAAKCLSDTDLVLPKPTVSRLEYDYKNYCRSMKSVQHLVERVLLHLQFEIHREASFKGISEVKSNVLITGLSGAGKSSLCHIVQKELTVWSHILHCRSLKGRKDIPEVLGKAILICQEHSPSVLICDDLDALVPPNVEGASPQDMAYYLRLAVVIKHLLQTSSGVCVLLTAMSMKSLHPTLGEFNGRPLFTAHFEIPELEQEERVELLKHLINDRIRASFEVDDDDVIKMAMATGGSSVRDVTDYLNRRIFKAVKKKKANPDGPRPRLIEDIAKDEETAKAFDIWGPVGGMEEAKRVLTEAIFWPILHPALFRSARCGVLLYGPPGSGKSHLGSSLARLSGVRMLSVKGPELLSKYIGQSERAVRDIFDKADMKRPCILFFDEFDSLAPRRGHDSTGVTDRVVNQLLARLDGAEGGARGPVVAATSRPDLVDPALLRPGRLQSHVYCGLPAQRERLEILRILSKDVPMDGDVDLEGLAERTEHFSPADLKSLLITAQLGRLEKQLQVSSEEKDLESVVVHREDVESALKETKPSLSKEQRLFYDTIYRRFRGETLSPEQRQVSKRMLNQRVTLA
ncbi:unnamed protein product, partial [Iphiclides podalirius]